MGKETHLELLKPEPSTVFDGGKDKVTASFDMVFAMLKVMHEDLESLKKETVATVDRTNIGSHKWDEVGGMLFLFAPVCLLWWQVHLTCSWIFLETPLALFGMPFEGVRDFIVQHVAYFSTCLGFLILFVLTNWILHIGFQFAAFLKRVKKIWKGFWELPLFVLIGYIFTKMGEMSGKEKEKEDCCQR